MRYEFLLDVYVFELYSVIHWIDGAKSAHALDLYYILLKMVFLVITETAGNTPKNKEKRIRECGFSSFVRKVLIYSRKLYSMYVVITTIGCLQYWKCLT